MPRPLVCIEQVRYRCKLHVKRGDGSGLFPRSAELALLVCFASEPWATLACINLFQIKDQ